MKRSEWLITFFIFLFFVLQCKWEKKTLVSEENPVDCDLSGRWNITIIVSEGSHVPAGTLYSAVLSLDQLGSGDVNGTLWIEGVSTAEVTGTVSGVNFDFEIGHGAPCIISLSGSGTVSQNCTKLSGKYSGSDCVGIMKADFSSDTFTPEVGL